MRTRKMRLMSFVLALAMMLAIAPVSAFADDAIEGLTFDATGTPVRPADAEEGKTYFYSGDDNKTQWALSASSNYLAIRHGYTFAGPETQAVNSSVAVVVAGTLTGGIFNGSVSAYDYDGTGAGCIKEGVFLGNASVTGSANHTGEIAGGLFAGRITSDSTGKITGGIFANDPGSNVADKHTLTAAHCKVYSEYAYSKRSVVENGYIMLTVQKPNAYVVGSQTVTLKCDSQTFEYWKVNDEAVKESDSTYTLGTDADGSHTLTFTVSDDVKVTPAVTPIAFHFNADTKLPEYNGEPYMGDLDLDGWYLSENTSGANYSYALTVKQGTTVDFENKVIPANWAFSNYGTMKNGILPGNVVNRECTSTTYGDELGKYGRVENIAFKMNVNFGDQNPNITWVTLKNATACEVFPDIVGVIGEQTITIKPTISADLFKGWVVGGDISDELAEQIEKQKDSDTLVLKLDGEKKDRIAIAAKTEGDTFGVKMLDGKATVDGQTVTAALPGETVTITMDDSEIPEGMSFDHWVVSPDMELEGGFKATDRTTSFTMPTEELTIYASLRTDSDDGVDAMTVVAGVAIGAGAAVLTYHIGTELYAKQVLGDGVAIPRTREDVALKAWELAGKPAVAIDGEPLSETAQAEKWAVESGLMQNVDGGFNGAKKMSKLKALRVLDSAKKMNAQE